MQLNDWAFDDIRAKMRDMSLFDLQMLYIEKHNKYREFALFYLDLTDKELKEKLEIKGELIRNECIIISLKMAEILTGKEL